MAAQNSPSAGFSQGSPPVFLSFQSRVSSDIAPYLVAIEVSLKFKHSRDNGVIYQRILGESTVSFAFLDCSFALCLADYFEKEFHSWMPALNPSLCGRLARDIVQYAHRVGVANGGAMVVTASMEVEEEEHPLRGYFIGLQAEDDEDDEISSKPRGLSWDEIKRLKEERFENNGGDESVCSVCLEKFFPGGKVSPLPCSHVFHNGCLTSWLEKSASCPLCRFDVTNHLATTCFYECS